MKKSKEEKNALNDFESSYWNLLCPPTETRENKRKLLGYMHII